MNASDAAGLHERTKHTWKRLRAISRGLDWGNYPFPFKLYPDLEPLALPRGLPESSLPATQVLSGHSSVPASALDLAGLARLLFFAAGVTRILHGVMFRAAPSAGALYPTELYAVCGPLADLPAGVYHFEPAEFALRRLREGDLRARLAASAAEPAIAGLPLCLVLTGIPWRTTWKYRERGYRHLFWDAGAIVANLLAVAAAAGWDARVLLGFVDQEVSALLGIGAPEEYPLALVTVDAPTAAEATGSPPLAPSAQGRVRCHARRAATYWSPPPSVLATFLAPRRSVPGATRRAGSGPSRRPSRFRPARSARCTRPPTRSRP